jgi:hypothetical protein
MKTLPGRLITNTTCLSYREEAENVSELSTFPIDDQRGPDMLTAQGAQLRHYIRTFADASVHLSPLCFCVD